MARLTWQNVNNPNFTGIGDNFRVMSQLLGNATQSGQDILNTYNRANAEAADRAILQRMVGVQDPAQFDPNAIIGQDGSRASLDTLKGVGNYADTLLSRAATRDNIDWNRYGRGRVMEGNQVMDANADAINMARSMAVAGDIPGAQRILGGIQGLRPEQFGEILGDVDTYGTRSLARDVTRQNMDVTGQRLTESRYGFGRQIRNDNAGDTANALIAETIRKAGSPQDARLEFERQMQSGEISPEAFSRAIQGLSSFGYGNIYAPFGQDSGPAAGATASAPGTAGTRQGSPYDVTFQFAGTDRPISSMSINDVLQHQTGMIRSQGHSPVGAFQINKDTLEDFAPRVLGSNWREQPLSPENQEKIAEAIFNARKRGNLKETWAALPDATPGAYANKPWSQVRQEIAQREVGAELPSAAEAAFGGHMVERRLEERLGQNNATGITATYGNLASDGRDANQIVSDLVGEGGPFAGTNRGVLLDYINYIVNESGGRINPAIAGEMLSRSTQGADNVVERAGSIIADVVGAPFGRRTRTPNLGGGIRLNDDAVYSMMDDYLSGNTSQRTLANESMGAMAQVQQQAQAQYQTALQQYQAALMDSRTRPGAAQNLPRYREAVQRAAAQLRATQEQVAGNPNWRPNFDITTPEEEELLLSASGPRGGGAGGGR